MNPKYTNHLAKESSPYLLQHAHNPVDWYPWGDEALDKAKRENKLILVSVGYSACHWCHVMERESFEDENTAQLMNQHFVCIKVDREERPDIDQIYMLAVQIMTGQGGWPLNCFALPDGKPIYGGTYFPNKQWKDILLSLSTFYANNPQKAREYADELTKGIHKAELVKLVAEESIFSMEDAQAMVKTWKELFDNKEGGPCRAPKFPLPNNYEFLLRYYYHTKDESIWQHIKLTLDKMAMGGIYDQVGGGFARYSTDTLWKIPHFEKMLYDNAQMVSLYAHAYQQSQQALYKEVVYQTLGFVEREMTTKDGGFYSALDADSEGEEGKYYVWTKEELETVLDRDFNIMSAYWNVNAQGLWEHGNYILLRNEHDEAFAKGHHVSLHELQSLVENCKQVLLQAREQRVKPGLDDKQLTSWNAMMLKGYIDAYTTFNEPHFLKTALNSAHFIINKLKGNDGRLFHNYKNGKASINGYLEDYAFTIDAFIALYEATFDEQWLLEASHLTEYVTKHFQDEYSMMFYFTSNIDRPLIARKMEINDNVIPASNSMMAKCLLRLALYNENSEYERMARQMLANVKENMPKYGSGYSNWGLVLLDIAAPFYEIAICGAEADSRRQELSKHFLPNKVLAGSREEGNLPLVQNRHQEGKTLIYVCEGKTCKAPQEDLVKAIKHIQQ